LYTQYCATCHGAGGEGDGKAGEVIGGVANLKGGAYINLPEGHIFHVIMTWQRKNGSLMVLKFLKTEDGKLFTMLNKKFRNNNNGTSN
jgi:hypothetical protein